MGEIGEMGEIGGSVVVLIDNFVTATTLAPTGCRRTPIAISMRTLVISFKASAIAEPFICVGIICVSIHVGIICVSIHVGIKYVSIRGGIICVSIGGGIMCVS